ncbi:porin [Photobacterium damselae]|uniref:Outer membrane protein OmpU n=3 Tax=Photobacterium damselae TaxID=38293 RepID=D0Z563_PHODD|nr:porin [Photobacterium damselae]EEZ39097.1 outer membrane protein OmpU [Photobacterium damselae subsp. damselae CIP 102761]KAB1180279.1 porin [Photobacterium damselae subsp. damselae]PSW80261.1 porin [Photobacterium damselae]SPY46022.1 Outer membrane porin protein OmpD precursor [Photobacterium damselae]
MSKNKIALGLLSLASVSGAANAANIYKTDDSTLDIGGRIEARAEHRDDNISDLSRVRLKIEGETKITDSVSGIAQFEQEFKDNSQKTRHLYAGIKSVIGNGTATLVYGKTDGSMSLVTDITDIQAAYGAIAADKYKVGKRIANSLAFDYMNENGTSFAANYAGAEGKDIGDFDNGFSIGASQSFGDTGLIAGIGYAKQEKVDKKEKSQLDYAIGYQYKKLYIGALYSARRVGDKEGDGYDVVTAYKINSTYKATVGFGELHFDKGDDSRAVNADITAKWNSHFRTYAAVNRDLVNKDTQGMLGARYDF